jgi:hypothetical protein
LDVPARVKEIDIARRMIADDEAQHDFLATAYRFPLPSSGNSWIIPVRSIMVHQIR